MKGVIYTELLAMAEHNFGEGLVDRVIDDAALPSGGAYTAVGNYPCEELFALVGGFAKAAKATPEELQRLFGHWMMQSFARHYPQFFDGRDGCLDMLEAIENDIHVEVRKLYPDADLPRFETTRGGPQHLDMTYRSPRPLADFCHGLIEACAVHFGETIRITRQDSRQAGQFTARFEITTGPGR